MNQLIVLAAATALAASMHAAAANDAPSREKSEYDAAKVRCEKLSGRARENCLTEATARYQAQLKQTQAEHRNDARTQRDRGDPPATATRRPD